MNEEPDGLEVVGSFSSPFDAHLARGRLEGGGIECWVFNDVPGARHSPVVLCVRRPDLEEARELLSQLVRGSAANEKHGAVRAGLVIGGMAGGVIGFHFGWPAAGLGIGIALGIVIAILRWNTRNCR